MMKTSKKASKKASKSDLSGYRTVVLTNGSEYVHNFNTTFGIIVLGPRQGASEMFLQDAVDVIKEINRYGAHKIWAELI